jgi:hypothetical protein
MTAPAPGSDRFLRDATGAPIHVFHAVAFV